MTDSETRRQAASDFTKALMEQFESQITAIVTQYVGAYLQVSSIRPGSSFLALALTHFSSVY